MTGKPRGRNRFSYLEGMARVFGVGTYKQGNRYKEDKKGGSQGRVRQTNGLWIAVEVGDDQEEAGSLLSQPVSPLLPQTTRISCLL